MGWAVGWFGILFLSCLHATGMVSFDRLFGTMGMIVWTGEWVLEIGLLVNIVNTLASKYI